MSLLKSKILKDNNDGGKSGWCQNDFNPDLTFFTAIQSGLALNAMPTPYAREEVVKQAFETMGNQGISIDFDKAGYTYQQLVSDTLDVLEMLFDYELYKDTIKIRHCRISRLDYPQSNDIFENGRIRQVSYLKEALERYNSADERYLVTYEGSRGNYVLAMSCPETLFFTTSRLDRNNGAGSEYVGLTIPRKDDSGEYFFAAPRPLSKRSRDFQDYLYNLVDRNKTLLGNTAFGKFISCEFGSNYKCSLDDSSVEPLIDESKSEVKILMSGDGYIALSKNCRPQSAVLINDTTINLGYKLNSNKFKTVNGWNTCLLPIRVEALAKMKNPDVLINNLRIVNTSVTTVDEKGNTYKLMSPESKMEQMLPLDLGIYPFFKYPENYPLKGKNTYNIVLSYQCENYHKEDVIELSFYKKTESGITKLRTYSTKEFHDPSNGIKEGVIRGIRSNNISNKCVRTLHYMLIGSQFDYIQVEFNLDMLKSSGLLCPQFNKVGSKNDKVQFAVDFGTTSTYIAARFGQQDPVVMSTGEESMVFLHDPNKENGSTVYKYESYNHGTKNTLLEAEIPELVRYIKNEFVPSSIDNEVYKFPIRTAMSTKEDVKNPELFVDANVAFTYDKEPSAGNNKFITNIKWAPTGNEVMRLYIKEIIRLCTLYAMSEGYNINNIEFLYFYPLSMGQDTYNNVKDAWIEGAREYGIEKEALHSMTESLAPYFAASKDDASCVVSVDIGGGSVDVVVYKDRAPKYAFSTLFGCDVLWSGGKNNASNDKTNPIYIKLRNSMQQKIEGSSLSNLKEINSTMTEANSQFSSPEIINFWLSNDVAFKVTEHLRQQDYYPVYIGHFYSILYHVAQTMKVKEMGIPAEITLSGNGSTYLNYIHPLLPKIAKAAFTSVYGECDDNIKVTLPSDLNFFGKEMTAIGGLKYNFSEPEKALLDDKNFIYLGGKVANFNPNITEDVTLVKEGESLKEDVVNDICSNVLDMEAGLAKLFKTLKIKNNGDFFSSKEEHRTTLKEIVEDTSAGNFYVNSTRVESTLFFVPVRQMIFKLEQNI